MEMINCFVHPVEEDLEKAEAWNFHIPGDTNFGICFPEDFQLTLEAQLTVHIQEYTSDTYTVRKGAAVEETLDPSKHLLKVPESLQGLIFFRGVECYFKDMTYIAGADSISTSAVNWLNKICTLEHSMIESEDRLKVKKALGFIPAFHEPTDTLMYDILPEESGKQLLHVAIPQYPFRAYPPFLTNARKKETSSHIIPPGLNMCIKLYKETTIPLLNRLAIIGGYDVKSRGCQNKEGQVDMKRFQTVDSEEKAKFCLISKVSYKITNPTLYYKKVNVTGGGGGGGRTKISRDFLQSFSAYRIVLSGLDTTSSQNIALSWDVPKRPKAVFLFFVRDAEIQFKTDMNTTVCPEYSFRPQSLNTVTVKKSSQKGPLTILQMSELDSRNPTGSWMGYINYLIDSGFLSQSVNFWNLPARIPSDLKDRGTYNIFPIDLSPYSKESFQLSLEFTSPPEAGWKLGALYIHDCQAKFPLNAQSNSRSFEFMYI